MEVTLVSEYFQGEFDCGIEIIEKKMKFLKLFNNFIPSTNLNQY